MVDIANPSAAGQAQREVQRSDLDSVAPQESQSDILANRLTVGRASAENYVSRLSLTTPKDIVEPRP